MASSALPPLHYVYFKNELKASDEYIYGTITLLQKYPMF